MAFITVTDFLDLLSKQCDWVGRGIAYLSQDLFSKMFQKAFAYLFMIASDMMSVHDYRQQPQSVKFKAAASYS